MKIAATYNKNEHYLYIFLIILCGVFLFRDLSRHMDILFSDEGNYLLIARNMFGQFDNTFGPLYSIWLKLWSYLIPDPVQLYYINYAALSIIVPVLLYLLLCQLSFNSTASFFASLSILYSTINVTLWPRVSHFGLVLVLSGLLLALRCGKRVLTFQILALTALITSYARPEYFMLSVIFGGLSLYYAWKERTIYNKIQVGSLYLFFFVILLAFKAPATRYAHEGNYTRSYIAFIQHYYLGLSLEGKKFDYWWLSIKDFYWFGEFKKCDGSVFKFMLYYTPQFIHHVIFDIKMYVFQIISKILLISNPVISNLKPRSLLMSCLFYGTAIAIYFRSSATRIHCLELIRKNKFSAFVLFLLIVPSLAACMIIMPRDHYIFLQIPFFILWIGLYAEIIFFRVPKLKFIVLPIVIICLCFQHTSKYGFIKASPKATANTNVELIKYINDSLPKGKNYQLFTDNIFMTGLLPQRFTEPTLMEYSFDFKNFRQFVTEKNTNLIIVTPTTNLEPYLRRDTVWNNFLKDPASIGFRRIYTGQLDSTFQLYIK